MYVFNVSMIIIADICVNYRFQPTSLPSTDPIMSPTTYPTSFPTKSSTTPSPTYTGHLFDGDMASILCNDEPIDIGIEMDAMSWKLYYLYF